MAAMLHMVADTVVAIVAMAATMAIPVVPVDQTPGGRFRLHLLTSHLCLQYSFFPFQQYYIYDSANVLRRREQQIALCSRCCSFTTQ